MLQRFLYFLKEKDLLNKKNKFLLAVSGGIDSVVMCELYKEAKLKFDIAHCNFKLRGIESNEDEMFVKSLATKYKVSFFAKKFDAKTYASKNKFSIQMAARELRYNWLEQLRQQNNYTYIAIAQHTNDAIETLLINLIRGTGIAGLHGILPHTGNIIRPLLYATRSEIKEFASKNHLAFREDSSNLSDKYIRNKLRHHVIPILKEINPNLEETILENINKIKDVEYVYHKYIEKKKKQLLIKKKDSCLIPINRIKKLKVAASILFEILREFNFNATVVKEIILALDGASGKVFYSPTHQVLKDREQLIVTKLSDNKNKIVKRRISIEDRIIKIDKSSLRIKIQKKDKKFIVPSTKEVACFDIDSLSFPLTVRKWEKGDYFYPLGMQKKKKLSDYLIDAKIPVTDKKNIWVITADSKIIWIIGHRIDDRFKITDNTKSLYIIEYIAI